MEIKTECPWCKQHYSVDESFIGQDVECSVCKKNFTVKDVSDPEKNAFSKKSVSRKVIIVFATLVIVLCPLCVICYSVILAKEHKIENSLNKGMEAIDKHHYEDAVKFLQSPASHGNSKAQLLLGMCYYNGDGVKRDNDEAVKWFRKAAEQNNVQAQFKLGLCYLAGVGVNPREDEAFFWLQKSAEQGYYEAQIYLGDHCYSKGNIIGFSEAHKWYQKALEMGMLSKEDELKVQAKMQMCITFEKAYEGNAAEQLIVHKAYEDGLFDFRKDKEEALAWLRKAANSGYPEAQCLLGVKYFRARDYEKAVEWLEKAGEQGNTDAMELLIEYYSTSPTTIRKANQWLDKLSKK